MIRSRIPIVALAAGCAGLLLLGCDPKRVVGDGTPDDGNPTPQVQPEARIVTAILGLHMEILRASLSQSAAYDTGARPVARAFTSPCVAVTLYESTLPAWEIRFDGCVDQDGTQYRGGGQAQPLAGVDGYYFLPYGNVEDKLIATNSDQSFNHVFDSGALELAFQRSGTGAVNGVQISKYLRHMRGENLITIAYSDVEWIGTHGDWADWPKAGEAANGTWDSVSGPFQVEFSGGSTVRFTLTGIPYVANLANGSLQVEPQ
ncbi:MAG: hypothetical protein ACRDGR_09040 [bacterium]